MNNATRVTVAALGVVFGISGMSHGFSGFVIHHGSLEYPPL